MQVWLTFLGKQRSPHMCICTYCIPMICKDMTIFLQPCEIWNMTFLVVRNWCKYNKFFSEPVVIQFDYYYSWGLTNRMRPIISCPDQQYQVDPFHDNMKSPHKAAIPGHIQHLFSLRTASKIHEHFDQQNEIELNGVFCQISRKIVKQRRWLWPLRRITIGHVGWCQIRQDHTIKFNPRA